MIRSFLTYLLKLFPFWGIPTSMQLFNSREKLFEIHCSSSDIVDNLFYITHFYVWYLVDIWSKQMHVDTNKIYTKYPHNTKRTTDQKVQYKKLSMNWNIL